MTSRTGPRIGPDPSGGRGRGFTLIELILVMALVVIVIGTVSTSLSRFFHGRNLDSEARRLLALTRYGQSRAVSEGVPMRLWIDAGRRAYGLQGEYGGDLQEGPSKAYPLDPGLAVEVFQENRSRSGTPRRVNTGTSQEGYSLTVGIRFLADGTLDETSPDRIRIYEDPQLRPADPNAGPGKNEVWLATDPYRLRYEIATNQPFLPRR